MSSDEPNIKLTSDIFIASFLSAPKKAHLLTVLINTEIVGSGCPLICE